MAHVDLIRFGIVLVVIIMLVVIGWLELRHERKAIESKLWLPKRYLQELGVFLSSEMQDQASYAWLVRHAERMQREVGTTATAQTRLGLNRLGPMDIYPNGPRMLLQKPVLARDMAGTLYDVTQMYIGRLEERLEAVYSGQKSVFVCFRTGVGIVLILPLFIIIRIVGEGESIIQAIFSSRLGKLVTTVVGVVATVVGLIVDWSDFQATITNIFR